MYNQHKSQLFFLFTKLGSRKKVKGGNININDLQTKNINAASMIPGIQNNFILSLRTAQNLQMCSKIMLIRGF